MIRVFCLFFCWILTLLAFGQPTDGHNIITYNIRLNVASDGDNSWPNRRELFQASILENKGDIIGLQEVLPTQLHQIALDLPDYLHWGQPRDNGIDKGEYCPVFYNKHRYILAKQNTIWLSETPEKPSIGWDAGCIRICTYGLLIDRYAKDSFWVFNTHLDHVGVKARAKSIALLADLIKKTCPKIANVILMGDFNMSIDDPAFNKLKKVKQLIPQVPASPTFNGFVTDKSTWKTIDFQFVSHTFAVEKTAVLDDKPQEKFVSDHFGFLVRVLPMKKKK